MTKKSENFEIWFGKIRKHCEKRENVGYLFFLLFLSCFQRASSQKSFKSGLWLDNLGLNNILWPFRDRNCDFSNNIPVDVLGNCY